MSLRIRRGTDEQRQGVVFDSGELVVTTDEFKLFVGDGATAGGRNIATNLAGNGLEYNPSTESLDVSLNITTDDVPQGINNKYFSNELAVDAIGAALVAGNSTNSGISFVYGSTQDTADRINATVNLNLDSLSDVVINGTPSNGQVLKYNSTQGAWVPAADSGGGVSGLTALEDDLSPTLGGNLTLNNYNITGTGDITTTGSIYASTGLGGNLGLNSYNITGTGNININGTISAASGLGTNLNLNGHNITGTGNIGFTGDLDIVGGISVTGAGNTIYGDHRGSFVGTAAITALVARASDSNPDIASAHFAVTDTTGGAKIFLNVVTGDLTEPAAVAAGDIIGGLVVNAYTDTDTFKTITAFSSKLDATANLAADHPATTLTINVGNNSSYTSYAFGYNGVFGTSAIKVADGDATHPSIAFSTDASVDTGFFHPEDGVVCVSTNGQETARFDNGGFRSTGFIKVAQVSGSLPNPPEAGMIVLDGTTFKGYNGSGWVNLN